VSGRVVFVGAGPGDPELITVRGQRMLRAADVVVWAASLVHPALLREARPDAEIVSSSDRHLGEIVDLMVDRASAGRLVVRLHSGDPSVYGAVLEQMVALRRAGVPFEVVPGVSSLFAAAARLPAELTVPGISQTVILTRTAGRASPLPPGAELAAVARHPATLAIFLSAALVPRVVRELREAGVADDIPAVVAVRVGWPDEQILRTTVGELAATVRAARVHRQALILVGRALDPALLDGGAPASRLYDPTFRHLFRGGGEGGA
jgi:precorrin-4/cobalt-precorrin-4 C11-methyltransferase